MPANSLAQLRRGSSWSTPIEAVVEMASAADASKVLDQRQQVMLYNKQQGRSVPQLALPATGCGLLKASSCISCLGKIGRACSCQRYCK